FIMLLIFVLAFYACSTQKVLESHWLQRAALFAIPLPWIASETGWFVAEYGRQPWSIAEILPTHLSVSSRTPQELYLSLSAFLLVYGLLFIAEIFLMVKYVRLGPSSLYTGRYYFEKIGGAS
ncbi:MAG: cytochrome ubiquinol oxidase subunit I, partial [Methylococcales bacterium]